MADPPVFEAEYQNGTMMRPTVAVAQLLASPRKFLRKYPLNISDDGTLGTSGPTNRVFVTNHTPGKRPGTILRTHRMHTAESFNINLTNIGLPTGHQINAVRIATTQSDQAASWYRLNTIGAALMVTCQLTGCAFVIRAAGVGGIGAIECGHMLPTDLTTMAAIETGEALNTRLVASGNYLAVYGRNSYDHQQNGMYDRNVAIIGVRRNGQWKIYAQKKDTQRGIKSVHRVYPPE